MNAKVCSCNIKIVIYVVIHQDISEMSREKRASRFLNYLGRGGGGGMPIDLLQPLQRLFIFVAFETCL